MCPSLTRQKFSIPCVGIKNCFLVKLRHVTGKCFFIQNRMLCSILFSIVNKEMGKKVHFHHNKDHFCSSFFILTTNFAKSGYISEHTTPLYSHFSGKTKSFTQKIQQKKVLQEDIPEVQRFGSVIVFCVQPFPHHFFTLKCALSLKCYISPNFGWILLNLGLCTLDV